MRNKKHIYSYALVIPALVFFVIFFIAPSIYGIYYSLTDWTIGKEKVSFIGLSNYKTIFQSSELRLAINNTFLYAIVVVIGKNLIGLLLALAVNTKMALRGYFRVVFFLPCVISTIIIGLVFVPILHPNGILNNFLGAIGLSFLQHSWLVDTKIVMLSIAAVSIWQWSGYHMVIYLAGLQGISESYYEAAKIDGASAFKRFQYITFPMLAPTFNINILLSLIGGLKVFSEPYALTNGGPGKASQVIALEVFSKFGKGQWGLGTALNVTLAIFVLVICIPVLHMMRKREVEE
jgi:raffinose/stachyose/melibiose transport system permease protein